jgi:hypothetical protein
LDIDDRLAVSSDAERPSVSPFSLPSVGCDSIPGHARAGGARSRAISDRISANIRRGTATVAGRTTSQCRSASVGRTSGLSTRPGGSTSGLRHAAISRPTEARAERRSGRDIEHSGGILARFGRGMAGESDEGSK